MFMFTPAIVLHTANIHRQAGVALVDGGVDAGGFFEHVGGVTGRTFIDHVAADHRHGLRGLVHPVAGLAVGVAGDGGGAHGHGAVGVVADTVEGDLALTGKAVLHRRGTEQTAKPFLHAEAAFERGAAQALQARAVEQHLQTGLVGKGQYGTAQGLRRDIEHPHRRLGSVHLRLHRIHGSGRGEQPQVDGQG